MIETHPLGGAQRLVIGALFVACGLVAVFAAFDMGPLDSGDILGPLWLGWVAGGIFCLAGLMIWVGRLSPLVDAALSLLLLIGLAALGNWVAFGAGERHCTGEISLLLITREAWSGLACRIPFGIGALMTNAMVLVFAVRFLQQALGGPPRLGRWVRFADGLLLLSLAPILLPIILVMIIGAAGKALMTRLETGQWPRNEDFIARQLQRRKKRDG